MSEKVGIGTVVVVIVAVAALAGCLEKEEAPISTPISTPIPTPT